MHNLVTPFQRFFDFKGRSRRSEYWPWTLVLLLINAALYAVPQALKIPWTALLTTATWGIFAATIIPSISLTVRRFHDTNRSGWWALYAFIVPTLAFQAPFFYFIAHRFDVAGAMGWGMTELVGAALAIATGLLILFALPTLIFLLQDGTPRHNRFGADPKGRGVASVF